jgi:UDP-N-acetylmuramate--alanine ligase
MFFRNQKIHFVGIGGAGMSAIAEILINLGSIVSGSDLKRTDITKYLEKLGAKIYIGHDKKNIEHVNVIVISSAINNKNIEVLNGIKNKIPVVSRAEMLSEISKFKYLISITGTHGKTTTTSFSSFILDYCGFNPTIVIGGKLKKCESNAKLGKGNYIVAEADESDGSFLKLSPFISVVTNIDTDHLDYYINMKKLKDAFIKHINSVSFYGIAILCSDNKTVREILPKIKKKYLTYGILGNPNIKAFNIKTYENCTSSFDISYMKKTIGNVSIKIPGKHNILNALASIGVGLKLKIPFDLISKAVSNFYGVKRRFEIKGEKNGIMIIDDYAHHPTEIIETLKTIKSFWPNRRLVVLFQPHRYSRTMNLFKEFGESFKYANFVNILNIYSAGERKIKGISSNLILKNLSNTNCIVKKFSNLKNFSKMLLIGDIVLTLGAGDVWKKGEKLLTII